MNMQDTLNQRHSSHGSFEDNSYVAQQLKQTLRAAPGYANLTHVQAEALDMIAHKLSRIVCGKADFADHWHDVAGYATLVEERL